MIDDTGYRQIRMKVVASSIEESAELLDRLFGNPNLSTSLIGAGIVDHRPYFEVDLFGATSQVEEALAHVSQTVGNACEAGLEPVKAHA